MKYIEDQQRHNICRKASCWDQQVILRMETSACVESTGHPAFEKEFKVGMLRDATAASTEGVKESTARYLWPLPAKSVLAVGK